MGFGIKMLSAPVGNRNVKDYLQEAELTVIETAGLRKTYYNVPNGS